MLEKDQKQIIDIVANFCQDLTSFLEIPTLKAKNIVKNLMNNMYRDPFYIAYLQDKSIRDILNKNNLIKITSFLKAKGLTKSEIRSVMIHSPAILLFAFDIENIYLIFKADSFKGYLLIFQNEFKSYRALDENYGFEENLDDYMLNYDYIVQDMLLSIKREDVKTSLKSDDESSLQEKCNNLLKSYSLKNYFLKK